MSNKEFGMCPICKDVFEGVDGISPLRMEVRKHAMRDHGAYVYHDKDIRVENEVIR